MATKTRAKKEPLRAYVASKEVIAHSYDGGLTWAQVPQREEPVTAPQYTRRVIAVYPDQITPSFQRRLIAWFSPLWEIGVLSGWGTLDDVIAAKPEDVDVIVVPIGPGMVAENYSEVIETARRFAPHILVDLDPFLVLDEDQAGHVFAACKLADAVTAPSELVTMRVRQLNPQAWTVPPVVNPDFWRAGNRQSGDPIRFAVQPTNDRFVRDALEHLKERWGERVELLEDNLVERNPTRDPDFYEQVDVVVVGPPANRTWMSPATLLPAMYAGCAVVADGSYHRTILHGHSGTLVAKPGPQMWRQELGRMVSDSNHRLKMGKGARQRAHQQTARSRIGPLAHPFRMLVPDKKEAPLFGQG